VNPPSLLGRFSLGAGGPDTVAIGDGLSLNSGTLSASALNLQSLPTQTNLSQSDQFIIDSAGALQFAAVGQVRELFTAGANVTIDSNGVISASAGASISIPALTELSSVSTLSSGDLIPVSQNSRDYTITYANLLNGVTIDMAQTAGAASDGDTFWVAQSSNVMLRQTLSSLWPWVSQKLPTWHLPVIELTANTTLDGVVHNNAVVVCSSSILISAVAANLNSGFRCELINASSGLVTFSGSVLTSNGSTSLSPYQCGTIYCVTYSVGSMVFVSISASGLATTSPGQAIDLATNSLTSNGLSISWSAPTSGGNVAVYTVQYRLSGTTTWLVAGQTNGALIFTLGGLQASTSYDLAVSGENNIGAGPLSSILTVTTPAAMALPGQPTGVNATNITSNSMTCSWTAPTVGGTGLIYEVQYSISGQTTWNAAASNLSVTTIGISNLLPGTAYDLQVIASNSSGSGLPSTTITAQTVQVAGSVTGITWALAPTGSYAHGVGAIGLNAHVNPESAAIQFGFSPSSSSPPTAWSMGVHVNSDLWGQYLTTPATAGTWYAWAEGSDGSCPTVYATSFTVT